MSDGPPLIEPEQAVVPARPVGAARPPEPQPLSVAGVTRRDAALDLALVALVLLVVPVGFDLLAGLLAGGATQPAAGLELVPFWMLMAGRKWFDALLATGVAAYLVYRHRLPAAAFGLQPGGLGRQVLWSVPALAGVYAAFGATLVVLAPLMLLFPGLHEAVRPRTEFIGQLPVDDLAGAVLLLVPVAIHEELVFRGLLIPLLRRLGWGWPAAVLTTAAAFALLHGVQGWLGVVQVFPVAVALGTFFVLSRSLLAVVLAHFAFDLLQFQVARFVLPWIERAVEAG